MVERKYGLGDNDFFCLRCNKVRQVEKVTRETVSTPKGMRDRRSGICSHCEHPVFKQGKL